MTPTIPDYVTPEYLSSLVLLEGLGSGAPGQRCAMQEIRAWLGLDASIDAIPPCVCPVLGRLIVHLQDAREDWRAALVPLLPRLVGSAGDEEVTRRRAYRCADWVCRVAAPAALEAAGLTDSAARLRRLAPVTDRASARDAAAEAAAAEAAYAAWAALAALAAEAAYAAGAAAWAERAVRAARDATDATDAWAARSARNAPREAGAETDPVALVRDLLEIT